MFCDDGTAVCHAMIKILVDFGKEVTCIIASLLWGHSWGHMTSFVMNFVHHNAFVRLQLKAAMDLEEFYSSAFVTQNSLSTGKIGKFASHDMSIILCI